MHKLLNHYKFYLMECPGICTNTDLYPATLGAIFKREMLAPIFKREMLAPILRGMRGRPAAAARPHIPLKIAASISR